jgi:hypothetical protein
MRIKRLIERAFDNPRGVPPYIKRLVCQKTGLDPWGVRGPIVKATELRYKFANYPYKETSIWERDWDMLVVLDACRPDWMRAVQDEFEFIPDVDTIHSVGSHSDEWISKTFNEKYADEMANTIYITGNHYAEGLEQSSLHRFETAHDYGTWAYDAVSPPANIITDLAVKTARESDWERCIVHYMQPHKPFLHTTGDRGEIEVKNWSHGYGPYKQYFEGNISLSDIHDGFISNLRYVLNEVELLLGNIDAPSTVLTSDHAQALGEGGLWDHTVGVKHTSMREVPWVETSASNQQNLEPKEFTTTDYDRETVRENLRLLGYQ